LYVILGNVLLEMGDLDRDAKYWSHPEAYLLLAKIAIQSGERESARGYSSHI
jgi:hypothetical protein